MKYKLRLIIIGVILLCLLPAVAPGDQCIKTIWVDGAKQTPLAATNLLSQDFDRLTIGADGDYVDPNSGIIGQMDEFAIYDDVLPDACIVWHASFNQGDANYVTAVQSGNPLLYFKFEDTDANNGGTVLNSGSKVGHNGTYIGDGVIGEPNLVAGYIGNCVEFYGADGSNGTCIDVNDDNSDFFPADGNVTVEFWMNVPSPADGETRWWFQHTGLNNNNGYGGGVTYYFIEAGNEQWYNYLRGGGSSSFVDINTCEQWRHIVITYESATTGMGDYYTEVSADDPCLWIRFEETDPCDWSGHNYWVEAGSETSIGSAGGGIGNCIYFPGSDESYVAAANQGTEPNDDPCFGHQYAFTDSNITWEFWYRAEDLPELPDYASFFQQSDDGEIDPLICSPNYEMAPGDIAGNRWSRYRYNHPTMGPGYANQNPNMRLPLDDGWHHIVFSWREEAQSDPDANQMEVRLCIDGQSVKTKLYPNTSPQEAVVGGNVGEMDHIVIGAGAWRDAAGTGASYIGYMDEFAIYGGVLPIERVVAHYDAGRPKNCAELWGRGLVPDWAEVIDKNQNCLIEFVDFAWFAKEWALCNRPGDCPPPF